MVFFATRGLLGPSGTNAGDIDVGTEVILNENGSPVNYLVVNQGIPENSPLYDASCEGTWLLRKDIREDGAWASGNDNTLPNSVIMTTMVGYLADFDAEVQEAIKTVKIPYRIGNGDLTVNSGANGMQCNLFPLGLYELGLTQSDSQYYPIDGAKLEYFDSGVNETSNEKRIAKFNGASHVWSSRSVPDGYSQYYYVSATGVIDHSFITSLRGLRPALILPYEFKFTSDQISA